MVTPRKGSQRDAAEITRDMVNQAQRLIAAASSLAEGAARGFGQPAKSAGAPTGTGSGTDQQAQSVQTGIFSLLPRADVVQDAVVVMMHSMVDLFDKTTQGFVDLLAGKAAGTGTGTGQAGSGQAGTDKTGAGQSDSGQASASQSGPVGGVSQFVLPATPRGGSASYTFQVTNDGSGRVNDVRPMVWGLFSGRGAEISPASFTFSPANFFLESGQNLQVTMTLIVPADARPGQYSGTMSIVNSRLPPYTVSVRVLDRGGGPPDEGAEPGASELAAAINRRLETEHAAEAEHEAQAQAIASRAEAPSPVDESMTRGARARRRLRETRAFETSAEQSPSEEVRLV